MRNILNKGERIATSMALDAVTNPILYNWNGKGFEGYANEVKRLKKKNAIFVQPPLNKIALTNNNRADLSIYVDGKGYCIEVKSIQDYKGIDRCKGYNEYANEDIYILLVVGDNNELYNKYKLEFELSETILLNLEEFGTFLSGL